HRTFDREVLHSEVLHREVLGDLLRDVLHGEACRSFRGHESSLGKRSETSGGRKGSTAPGALDRAGKRCPLHGLGGQWWGVSKESHAPRTQIRDPTLILCVSAC